jgi:hypothetical protein
MPVNPAQLSNDRPVSQYSTDPVSNDIAAVPVAADASSATNLVPPADEFQVLRGGTPVPSAGTAGSPPPGKGTAAKDVGLTDIVGAVVNFLFQKPPDQTQLIKKQNELIKEQIETQQRFNEQTELNRPRQQLEGQDRELVNKTIREINN